MEDYLQATDFSSSIDVWHHTAYHAGLSTEGVDITIYGIDTSNNQTSRCKGDILSN